MMMLVPVLLAYSAVQTCPRSAPGFLSAFGRATTPWRRVSSPPIAEETVAADSELPPPAAAQNSRFEGSDEPPVERVAEVPLPLGAAVADRSVRGAERSRSLSKFGERHPGATDWLRRDAGELAWRSRLQRDWAEQDGQALDRTLAQMGTTAADEDDWRVVEFEGLLRREQTWRAQVYRWWLGVWDASGDEYLFEPGEDDTFGWPYTRLDGTPWASGPQRGLESRRGRRPPWEDEDEDEDEAVGRRRRARRVLPSSSRPRASAAPQSARRRRAASYYEEEEEDRGAEDMVYGGRPRRLGSWQRRGRRSGGRAAGAEDDPFAEDDEDDAGVSKGLERVAETLGGASARRRRDGRRSAREDEEDEEEEGYDDKGDAPRRRWFGWGLRERWRRWRSRGGGRANDAQDDAQDVAQSAPRTASSRRNSGRSGGGNSGSGGGGGGGGGSGGSGSASRTPRALVSVSSKQNAYIDRRLAVLAERVEDRLSALQEEERELLRRREEASERLRALRSSIELTGEVVLEDRDAVETKADRSQYRSLEAVVAQLRSQRDRAWDAIDETEARLEEIEAARRTLEKRGMAGMLAIVEERRAGVSPALRSYLAKLLEL